MKPSYTIVPFLLFAFSCDTTEPPPPPAHVHTISLAAVDSGVTEAWLRVSFPDTVQNRTFRLVRESSIVLEAFLVAPETVVVDTGLMPNSFYEYRALHLSNGNSVDTSSKIMLRTLDTTSHHFILQWDTLGNIGSSILRDVSIVSDTDLWAVGEVYQDEAQLYNAARWNGQSWALSRITSSSVNSIFGYGQNEVWAGTSAPYRWDGQVWSGFNVNGIFGGIILRIYGNGVRRIHIVGTNGSIAGYEGGVWHSVASGTVLPLNDIWGGVNPQMGGEELISVASNTVANNGMKLLKITGLTVMELPTVGLSWKLSGLWFVPGRRYYVVGDGLFTKGSVQDTSRWVNKAPGLTQYYIRDIQGDRLNNVVAVGDFGNFLHFNGVTWQNLQSSTFMNDGAFTQVAVRGNLVVAVGFTGNRAIVLRAYRQEI